MKFGTRLTLLVAVDCILVGLSVLSSYLFRYSWDITPQLWREIVVFSLVSVVIFGVSFYVFRLYHRLWRYASIGEMLSILKSALFGIIISYVITSIILQQWMSFYLTFSIFESIILVIGGTRFIWKIVRDTYLVKNTSHRRRALIVGAGDCGLMIVKEMISNPTADIEPIAFIDDNRSKHRLLMQGLPVVGGREMIQQAVLQHRIDVIIIAMPSVSRLQISQIIEICKKTKTQLKIIPLLRDIIENKVTLNSIKNVQVEDLLGRDPVSLDLDGITSFVEGKIVLVTGAGGSIGSELCRQLINYKPRKLLLLGHGENSIYHIEEELLRLQSGIPIEPIIADVKDKAKIQDVFRTHRPQVVFHAAAHKHVPMMEKNPSEAIKNNVFGTKNVTECADQYGAERFVLISTDKAVNPTSIMGVTKRIAEMITQSMNKYSKTQFSAVRFGNVLGSRGSVIPKFKEQIALGGPITVTHPEMTRYFMTIPEAVQLVIQTGALAEGGEIFILDMGEPVKILTLAEDLIRFSGFEPYADIRIEFTGIRPGEKLFEELLAQEEVLAGTKHDRIFIGKPMHKTRSEIDFELKRLEQVLVGDQGMIREMLKLIVPSYQHVS